MGRRNLIPGHRGGRADEYRDVALWFGVTSDRLSERSTAYSRCAEKRSSGQDQARSTPLPHEQCQVIDGPSISARRNAVGRCTSTARARPSRSRAAGCGSRGSCCPTTGPIRGSCRIARGPAGCRDDASGRHNASASRRSPVRHARAGGRLRTGGGRDRCTNAVRATPSSRLAVPRTPDSCGRTSGPIRGKPHIVGGPAGCRGVAMRPRYCQAEPPHPRAQLLWDRWRRRCALRILLAALGPRHLSGHGEQQYGRDSDQKAPQDAETGACSGVWYHSPRSPLVRRSRTSPARSQQARARNLRSYPDRLFCRQPIAAFGRYR